ncbi:AI-2E family transporter [Candidatus Gracilibacteria bacterium]|nr:AI-2E family transporter [Candidatus Gracilibacteria bacterium]
MSTELINWIKKILILIAILVIGYLLFLISSTLVVLLISGFITILIAPLVSILEKKHIHASFTIMGIYLIIIIIGLIVVGTIIPIIVTYVTDTVNTVIYWASEAQSIYSSHGIKGFGLSPYIEKSILFLFNEHNIDQTLSFIRDNAGNIQSIVTKQLSVLTSGGFSIISSVGGVFFNWILIAIMTFLMTLERKNIGQFILDIAPDNIELYLLNHYKEIQHTLNAWIKAMLILSFSIFFITYMSLTLIELLFDFDTNQTFTLALISGVMEFIPYVGPILALIPALIIGLGISWKVALAISILYLIIQQVENNILVPYVMSRSLDLSPFLVFIVMIIGASLGGILGIILAVPFAAIGRVIYINYRKNKTHKISGAKLSKKEDR